MPKKSPKAAAVSSSHGSQTIFDMTSPVRAKMRRRLPSKEVFDTINKILDDNPATGKRIFTAISQFFYLAYNRPDPGNGDISIVDTIARELSTGKPIHGIDHKIKGAIIYNCLTNAIKKIDAILRSGSHPNISDNLKTFRKYFHVLNSRLARELKAISDPTKRSEIQQKTGLDLNNLPVVSTLTKSQEAIVFKFHVSPKKDDHGNSPKYDKKHRIYAQWAVLDEINNRKAKPRKQRQRQQLKTLNIQYTSVTQTTAVGSRLMTSPGNTSARPASALPPPTLFGGKKAGSKQKNVLKKAAHKSQLQHVHSSMGNGAH